MSSRTRAADDVETIYAAIQRLKREKEEAEKERERQKASGFYPVQITNAEGTFTEYGIVYLFGDPL